MKNSSKFFKHKKVANIVTLVCKENQALSPNKSIILLSNEVRVSKIHFPTICLKFVKNKCLKISFYFFLQDGKPF